MDSADPVWPLLVLAGDPAGRCRGLRAAPPIVRDCLVDVNVPRRFWWMLTPIRLIAATGLAAGVWVPEIGLAACLGLVAYFVLAIGAHVRARDFGRSLFVNAIGMLILSVGTTYLCFLS
ncbi:MAG: DoxX family protein [Aeromicrobium sp.]